MSARPQHDGPAASEILVEVFDPEETAAPGLAGRLNACPLDRKVLVVSDEILLRIVLAEALAFAGVGVVQASDPAEAAEILGERSDIGVVVADVGVLGRVDDI